MPENSKESWQSKREIRRRKGKEHHSYTHPEVIVRGEDCWNAVLTMEKAREIRRRVAEGEFKKALAREFGVDPSLIRQICANKIWKENIA